jgi:signal transduction histidine kinase
MRKAVSIKLKLTLWYLLYLTIVLVFFSGLSYLILNQNAYHAYNNQISTNLVLVKKTAMASITTPSNYNPDIATRPFKALLEYSIENNRLKAIQSSPEAPILISTIQGTITIDQKSYITSDLTGNQEISLSYRDVIDLPGCYEVLVIIRPKTGIFSLIAIYKETLFIAIPATVILAGILGYLLVKKMLKPIENIASAAKDIQDTDLKKRISINNNDELGKLATILNQTFENLQRSFERERQFTSDASHELQTPLAIIQAEASLALTKERSKKAYQKTLKRVSQEINHMRGVVSKLLRLARADNGVERLNKVELNLKTVLEDLAEDAQILCEQKQILFEQALQDVPLIMGDTVRLKELFFNLLDNAIKYTPSGGKIKLSLTAQNKSIKIVVKDTGIGISQEHLPFIFERFYRVNKAHSEGDSGSGLGLAICKHVAELHKGQIQAESHLGEGSVFTVILPTE